MSLAALRASLADRPHHLSPFFVLGDPSPELSVELALRAVGAGATLLELGFPFSDPVADGPEVARAAGRALAAGTTTDVALDCLRALRARTDVPLNLLVYANLVHARGAERFARDAAAAGASSLLCPDVPLEEARPLEEACAAASLGLVQLVGPHSDDARIAALDASATAFLYLVSRQGITGAQQTLAAGTAALVRRVSERARLPVAVGFGLSRPEHLFSVFAAGARVGVVGSAFARLVRAHVENPSGSVAELFGAVEGLCSDLAAALHRPLSEGTPSC